MEMLKFKEQKEIDPIFNLFKENCKQHKFKIDKQTLSKYDENNKHFSIIKTITKEDGEEELIIIGYHCIYQYENYKIKFQYLLIYGIWKIISQKLNLEEEKKFNILLEDINNKKNLSLNQQIQFIINKFDQYFYELNQKEKIQQNQNSILKEEDDQNINLNDLLLDNPISTPSIFTEDDQQQENLTIQSEFIDSIQKLDCLTPPITPHRIRHDSSCSSTNSLKYTQFVPPSTVSIRRRRVIQSVLLHVQRKKKMFEKVVNQLKQTSTEPTLYELGLEFLRLHDGKFNYPPGYTFIMSFKNRTWFLTINNIKCVECELGESEPRSVLILQYKNKITTVQV